MHQIHTPTASHYSATTVQSALLWVLSHVLRVGEVVEDERGIDTRELRNVMVSIDSPWIWNLDHLNWGNIPLRPKWCDPEFMRAYRRQAGAKVRGDHPYVYGAELRAHPTIAYFGKGPEDSKIYHQGFPINQVTDYIVPKLVENMRSRRAVGFTWNVAEFSDLGAKEVPCLDMVQVMVRPDKAGDERLHLTGVLRSNEMYSAWAADVALLFEWQQAIVIELNTSRFGSRAKAVGIGSLTTVSNSAHIYKENWADGEQLCRNHGWLR